MTTEKLYLDAPGDGQPLLTFQATVLEVVHYRDRPAVILNRTAFYPEGGGQLGDRGHLRIEGRSLAVNDVQIDDRGRILHLIDDAEPQDWLQAEIEGQVDASHRRDMMSQHTGQHMLSAAFFTLAGLETVSARLGSRISTVDLNSPKLDESTIERVVAHVNDLVLEDRVVRPIYPNAEELARMNLRRAPKVSEDVRILEIEGFDVTPCGGTHCARTGQVGAVHVVSTERIKGMTRVNFLCGRRTLEYFRELERQARQAAAVQGCTPAELAENLTGQRETMRTYQQELGRLRARNAEREAAELLASHQPTASEWTPIVVVRESDVDSARKLANSLIRREDVLAAIFSRENADSDWRVILSRGSNAAFDCGKWFREAGRELGARGGGRPNHAEGKLPLSVDPNTITWTRAAG